MFGNPFTIRRPLTDLLQVGRDARCRIVGYKLPVSTRIIPFYRKVLNCTSYKREAYRGSEFAPRVLVDNNVSVVMKVCSNIHRPETSTNTVPQSGHPATNGRYLM